MFLTAARRQWCTTASQQTDGIEADANALDASQTSLASSKNVSVLLASLSLSRQEVLGHIKKENDYTEGKMEHLKGLREDLYKVIKGFVCDPPCIAVSFFSVKRRWTDYSLCKGLPTAHGRPRF